MKLYHFPPSPNARKVLATVKELGLDVEEQVVDLPKGATRQPEFLAVNPNGKIPALVDGDLKLWESHAIMRYLCRQSPDCALYPNDIKVQADIDRWLDWSLAHFGPPLGTATYEKLLKPMFGGQTDETAVAQAWERWTPVARVLDAQLADRQYITGDQLTLADYGVGSWLTYAHPIGAPVQDYPHIQAWNGRLAENPSWAATAPKFG